MNNDECCRTCYFWTFEDFEFFDDEILFLGYCEIHQELTEGDEICDKYTNIAWKLEEKYEEKD